MIIRGEDRWDDEVERVSNIVFERGIIFCTTRREEFETGVFNIFIIIG